MSGAPEALLEAPPENESELDEMIAAKRAVELKLEMAQGDPLKARLMIYTEILEIAQQADLKGIDYEKVKDVAEARRQLRERLDIFTDEIESQP